MCTSSWVVPRRYVSCCRYGDRTRLKQFISLYDVLQGQSIILSNFLRSIRSELSEWLVNLLINIQPLGVERCKGLKLSLLLIFSLLYSRRKHMPTVTYLRLDGSTPAGSRHSLVQRWEFFHLRFFGSGHWPWSRNKGRKRWCGIQTILQDNQRHITSTHKSRIWCTPLPRDRLYISIRN